MSEPSSKLDMNSLSEALEVSGEQDNPTKPKAPEEHAQEVMEKSNTLSEGDDIARTADTAAARASPETLSPPGSPIETGQSEVQKNGLTKSSTVPRRPSDQETESQLDPTTRQIKSMFPDLDTDTIRAVVVAESGDFERAINTLLQMSDPSYVPPPPFRGSSQADTDEQLARSLAAAEEDSARRLQHQQQSSVRGGALGSLFGFSAGQAQGNASQAQPSPTYDTSNLAYQPRVRRNPSHQNTLPGQQALPSASARPSQPMRAASGDGSQISGAPWPGPKEAKQWQEDINKFAETGLAKAASTFSALRQRGEQAWANRASPNATDAQGGGGGMSSGQRGGSFFSNWNQRAGGGQSTVSPTIGSHRGFDRDPSPVGDNELAKILARGRSSNDEDAYSAGRSNQRKGSTGGVADRYKKVLASQQNRGGKSRPEEDDDDDALGWDDAGRTGGATDTSKPFEAITISDNSATSNASATAGTNSKTGQRNAVSLMESSSGRGVTSPQTKTGPGNEKRLSDGHGNGEENDDDDDDLEYVANPFEDED